MPAKRALLLTLTGFFLLSLWWVIVQASGDESRQLFASVYSVMALWGAIWGFSTSQIWGGTRSTFGKALFLLSLGLLFQVFGQFSYSLHIYLLHVEVPYPSIGDVGYFGSVLLYICGAWLLAKTVGLKFGIRSTVDRVKLVIFPLVLLILSYFLFLQGYQFDFTAPVSIFLDFGYPLGQAVYLSIALVTFVLGQKFFGGVMQSRVFLLLLAFLFQYAADFMFLLQNQQGNWEVGRLNDFIYLCAYTLMAITLIDIRFVMNHLRVDSIKE